jgi:hypothetical protein
MPQAASKQGTFSGSRRMTVDAQLGGLGIALSASQLFLSMLSLKFRRW